MSAIDIINAVNKIQGDRPAYVPYDFSKVLIMYGTPPIRVQGVEYVFARHNFPQTKRIGSLNSKYIFVTNRNKSGIIEFGILDSVVSVGLIQVLQLTGIPMPLIVTDLTTGGTGSAATTACKQVGTPEWRKALDPSLSIFTFEAGSLTITNGIRLTV